MNKRIPLECIQVPIPCEASWDQMKAARALGFAPTATSTFIIFRPCRARRRKGWCASRQENCAFGFPSIRAVGS